MARAKIQSVKSNGNDAISILTEDHRRVKGLFTEFEKLMDSSDKDEQKRALFETICEELAVHGRIEEEIFYPAVRAAIDDDDLMNQAEVEHAGAMELIAKLGEMEPGDEHYDANVIVLGENVDGHVKDEQFEMFPLARAAGLDLVGLGEEMLELKLKIQEGAFAPQKRSRVG